MITILLPTLFGWIWLTQHAIEARFLYKIFEEECTSSKIGTRCLELNFTSILYINIYMPKRALSIKPSFNSTGWYLPRNYREFTLCKSNNTLCCQDMNKGYARFDSTAICAALILMCIIHNLMCMAVHFSYLMRKEDRIMSTNSESTVSRYTVSTGSSVPSQRRR